MKQIETLNEYRVFYHVFPEVLNTPHFTLFMFHGADLIGRATYTGTPNTWNLRKAVDKFVNNHDFFTADTLYKCLQDINADDDFTVMTGTIPGFSKRERFEKVTGSRFYQHVDTWN